MGNDVRDFPRVGVRERMVRLLRRLGLSGDYGGALVELALMIPIFILLLVGGAEFGRLEYFSVEVADAARAGAVYGAQSAATASNTSEIQSEAANDAPDLAIIATLTVTPTTVCDCSNGTSITCANTTACVRPARVVKYVQVNTSAPVNTILHYPGLPSTYTLQGQAIMRIE